MSNWNPWHGCKKISEGCLNCYMYYFDEIRGKRGDEIYKTKSFDLPMKKDRLGNYKIKSGEHVRTCLTSDFFLKEADSWRQEAWYMIKKRQDVIFWILTKRADRIAECLPNDWGDGYPNVVLSVTAENQERADERIPILLHIPAKYKGVMIAPFLGEINIEEYLKKGQILYIICGGENYENARPCDYKWVEKLYNQCVKYDVSFDFYDTGIFFIKNEKIYYGKKDDYVLQMIKSKFKYSGKPIIFNYQKPYDKAKQISLFENNF